MLEARQKTWPYFYPANICRNESQSAEYHITFAAQQSVMLLDKRLGRRLKIGISTQLPFQSRMCPASSFLPAHTPTSRGQLSVPSTAAGNFLLITALASSRNSLWGIQTEDVSFISGNKGSQGVNKADGKEERAACQTGKYALDRGVL